jgi:hypothetical protein
VILIAEIAKLLLAAFLNPLPGWRRSTPGFVISIKDAPAEVTGKNAAHIFTQQSFIFSAVLLNFLDFQMNYSLSVVVCGRMAISLKRSTCRFCKMFSCYMRRSLAVASQLHPFGLNWSRKTKRTLRQTMSQPELRLCI